MRNRFAVALAAFLLLPAAASAQDTGLPGLRRSPELLLRATSPDTLTGVRRHLGSPLSVPAFRIDALFVSQPFGSWLNEVREATRVVVAYTPQNPTGVNPTFDPREGIENENTPAALTTPPDTSLFLPAVPVRTPRTGADNALAGLSEYADLGVVIQGQGDLGGAWTRHKPCDPVQYFNCNPGLMPELKPDVKFGIVVGGTISERVHVDVDYDQSREFDAANNINVFYQGLTDEVLQRVEVGDVAIRLPSSRYLTRGVPSGNFGFMASGQLGPLELQTVFAQQKGDLTTKEFRFNAGTDQEGVEQDAELVIDDADYVKGQFFFIVPPSEIAGTPHVDALSLLGSEAPASIRPAVGGMLTLYRDERLNQQAGGNAQLGYFLADGVAPGGGMRHTGSFRRLQPEQDYIVHSSGLWIMLRSPLRQDEALAVSYVTETGDTIGVINAESSPAGVQPQLRLLRGPYSTHQPGVPTWDMEMHQVYRLDSSTDVDLSTVEMDISLGGQSGGRTFIDVLGRQLSFLRFFGLDEDSPVDRLDPAQVYQPARDGFGAGGGTPIGGTYIIFPTLRPFAMPAPVQSERLSSDELRDALANNANNAIYFDPDPVNRDAAGRFRLNFSYRVKVEGLQSSFSLGAIGLRQGSERLYLGGRPLERDIDYVIDYDLGMVTLKDPGALFATSPGAEIRATWEQMPLFNIAPTSMAGFHARYQLGARGDINVVGLYQSQKSLMSRPQLGTEPGSSMLGGVSGSFNFGGALVDRLVSSMGVRSTRPSALRLTGEMALSAPDPNPRSVAYLDDFESADEVRLSPNRHDWRLGSAPQSSEGAESVLPFVPDAASAWPLVWQDQWRTQDGGIAGVLPASAIDELINTVGNATPEPLMWLTWGYQNNRTSPLPPPADARRWRSITTVLSTTGRDMTRSEHLEFYVDANWNEDIALVFDLGTVSEDAMYIDSLGNTNGTYEEDGRPWGLGILDEEARLIEREVWGNDRDLLGLWDQPCRVEPLITYGPSDPLANCTRGNGRNNTEDLNGNGILDAGGDDGQYFRYVVRLNELSEYLVRDTTQTGTQYRLYRIPLRSGTPVNGASDATWRFIRHMRMTVAGEPTATQYLSLARMRIIGSRWTKRDVHGVMRGMLDDEPGTGSTTTDVRVGPVSQLTDGAAYRSPPGVAEEAQDPTQQYGLGGAEINEKSLRIAYTDLEAGERAEVYYRYPQQPRNMLLYSELRLWAVAREGRWGVDDGERLTVRIGTDPRNFYMFQSKLKPATGDRAVTGADWLPELVIDARVWQELKALAEQQLIERPGVGADTVWSADSAYAVVLEDRARAPNLAAVREIAFAVYNGAGVATSGEVWINDLRTNVPDRRRDMAANVGVDLVAGDLATGSITFANYGGLFRQLNESPSYIGGQQLAVNTEARLERLLPNAWGLELPLSVQHNRSADDPTYLQQSDVLADRLENLRESGSSNTRVGLRIRKATPTANPLLSLLLDGSALRIGWNTGNSSTVTSRGEQSGFNTDLTYSRSLAPRRLPIPLFGDALRALAPEHVESSDVFRRLVGSRFRWSPATLSFGSAYNDQMTRSLRYERILEIPGDTQVAVFESPRQALRNDAQLGFQFFEPMTLTFALSSERDLLASDLATSRAFEREALERERLGLGGMDLGWETGRSLGTTFNYRPQLTTWLATSVSFNNRYITSRSPSFLEIEENGADTTATVQRRFEANRRLTRTLRITPRNMLPAFGLDSTGLAGRLVRRVSIVDVSWTNTLTSAFERELVTPDVAYQLGLGSLPSVSIMHGDTAVRAQERNELRFASGIDIMDGLTLSTSYGVSETETFDRRGGNRAQRDLTPTASLEWRDVKLPEAAMRYVTSLSGRIGITRRDSEAFFRSDNPQRRTATDVSFPFSINVGFPHSISLSYNGSVATGENIDPTGSAERGTFQHNFRVSTIFQPPESWRGRLNGPVQVQLSYVEQQQSQCRYVPGLALADGCVAYLDVGTQTANLQVSTKLSDLDVGMLLNYVGRDNSVGTRNGSTQFQLQMYARFHFTAGQLPTRFP